MYSINALNNERQFYHFDEMGNTIFVSNETGTLIASYAYGPYGTITGSTGDLDNPFTWQGQHGVMQESASGLYYMRARYYDSNTRRFLSRDPVSNSAPMTINPYQYALANPLLYLDPTGLDARVNQAGVHTDISVDVWEGENIIGVLTASFEAKGRDLGGVLNGQGMFRLDFAPDVTIASTNPASSNLVVKGTRKQDERLLKAILKAVEMNHASNEEILAQLRAKMVKIRSQRMEVSKKGKWYSFNWAKYPKKEWRKYRILSQCCNDFTDAMLDDYFGKNWYQGPIFSGEGLMEELKPHVPPLAIEASGS